MAMITIFAVLAFHSVLDQVESSSGFFGFDKLYKDSDGFKLHDTLTNGLVSVDVAAPLPAPSLVQPAVHSVAEKLGASVVTSRILAESPVVASPGDFGSQSGLRNVLVIVLFSFLLAGVLIVLIWCICANMHKHRKHVAPLTRYRPPAPVADELGDGGFRPTKQPQASRANGVRDGGSLPTRPPVPSNASRLSDGGSEPTSNIPVPPVANGNGGDTSVAAQPSALPIAQQKIFASWRSPLEPRMKTEMRNATVELETRHPIIVTESGESSEGPSRLAEIGLIPFSYEELRDSTDDFSITNFLGEGGFAKVYKGSLSNGRTVAVKVLRNENSKSEKEFQNEVDIISRARHRNVVSLVGYGITETKRLIVYEFVENRSLHDHLRGGEHFEVMDWAVRIKIARGASKGFAYLHEECPQKIIHGDVKPANILLDLNFVPKVADFGISKLCPDHFDSLIATCVMGSVGFIDPVYFETGELSSKTDVYAFGVVLLMLISGLIDLEKVHGLRSELSRALQSSNFHGIADERLNNNYDVDEMTRMVTCADACLRREPKDRPDMIQISRVLKNIV